MVSKAVFTRNLRHVRTLIVAYTLLSALVYVIWACAPLLNTVYTYADGTGRAVDYRYTPAWWLVYLQAASGVLIFLLLSVAAEPESLVRTDVHLLASVLAIIVTVAVSVGLLVYYFFFVNTVYSGANPFNDYRWCCAFFSDAPALCPNSVPCTPDVAAGDLRVNGEWYFTWVWSIVLFFNAVIHYGINKLLHTSGLVRNRPERAREGRLLGTLFCVVAAGFFVYWAAFPLLNTVFVYGYPQMGIPPSVDNFVNARYDFQWWFLWLLSLNGLVPLLFVVAMAMNQSLVAPALQFWVTVVIVVLSFLTTLVFFFQWLFWCNSRVGIYSIGSICNDARWCCLNFADAPDWCPNVTPCAPQPAQLNADPQFLQHIYFSIVFWVLGGVALWLNYRMKRYGVFFSYVNQE